MTLPQKSATKHFTVLSASTGHGEFQKKSPPKSDPGKGVNMHIFSICPPLKTSMYY